MRIINKILCICGGNKVLKIGKVHHTILGFSITVQETPYYYCEKCEKITYDINTEIVKCLKYAYLNKLNEIKYGSII